MNVPFPSHLVNDADEDTKKLATDFWIELNNLARKNPAKYREKIAQVMKDAADQEKEKEKPRSSHDFIHHVFAIQTVSLLGNHPFRLNVLQSRGIKEMVGNEVPMLVSRVRPERKGFTVLVCDIIVNPQVIGKAKKDTQFQADLQDLMFESVLESSGHQLDKKQYKLVKPYAGQWLWRDDGTQFSDEELETVADLTVESMLSKLHLARPEADKEDERLSRTGAGPQRPSSSPISLVLPGQGMRRLDSKSALIEVVGESSSDDHDVESANPSRPQVVEVDTPVPATRSQEEQDASRPVILEVAPRPSQHSAPSPSMATTPKPTVPLITPIEPEQPTPAVLNTPYRPPEELTAEITKFIADCPPHAVRCAYTLLTNDGQSRSVQFDLSSILPSTATWAYAADIGDTTNVLEFEPEEDHPTLPWLSVRFFKLGAQLMVGPRVVHPVTSWLGGPLPKSLEPRFSNKTRVLTIKVSAS